MFGFEDYSNDLKSYKDLGDESWIDFAPSTRTITTTGTTLLTADIDRRIILIYALDNPIWIRFRAASSFIANYSYPLRQNQLMQIDGLAARFGISAIAENDSATIRLTTFNKNT